MMAEEKELTDFQVRWRYERIVLYFLDMTKHFHFLIAHAPDPELRKAADEAYDVIWKEVMGLRDRFKLAWVDSEEEITLGKKE